MTPSLLKESHLLKTGSIREEVRVFHVYGCYEIAVCSLVIKKLAGRYVKRYSLKPKLQFEL